MGETRLAFCPSPQIRDGCPNGALPADLHQGVFGSRLVGRVEMVGREIIIRFILNLSRSSELLLSMPFSKRHPAPSSPLSSTNDQSLVPTQVSDVAPTTARHPHAPALQTQPEDERALDLEFETQEDDLLFSARTFIESREPMRAIHVLRQCRSSKAHFLSLYSQFIVSLVPPMISSSY